MRRIVPLFFEAAPRLAPRALVATASTKAVVTRRIPVRSLFAKCERQHRQFSTASSSPSTVYAKAHEAIAIVYDWLDENGIDTKANRDAVNTQNAKNLADILSLSRKASPLDQQAFYNKLNTHKDLLDRVANEIQKQPVSGVHLVDLAKIIDDVKQAVNSSAFSSSSSRARF